MAFHWPLRTSTLKSSSSSVVEVGRMMSANRQSFSIQGCCTSTNSRFGWRSASWNSWPPFQQVDQQGASDQIMRMPLPGSGAYLNGMSWSARSMPAITWPCHSMDGSVMALWIMVLGMNGSLRSIVAPR